MRPPRRNRGDDPRKPQSAISRLLLNNYLFMGAMAVAYLSFAMCVACIAGQWQPAIRRGLFWLSILALGAVAVEFGRERLLSMPYEGLGAAVIAYVVALPLLGMYVGVLAGGFLPRRAGYLLGLIVLTCLAFLYAAKRQRAAASKSTYRDDQHRQR